MSRSPSFRLRQGALLALAVQLAFPSFALAGNLNQISPQGPTVVAGQASFKQPNANTTLIQASNGTIINWNQFSIGAGQTTRFIEPNAGSAVLNRVVGSSASSILGQLQSNGHVFLVNPSGIVIGVGARIDTNGFIASTLDISDADFLAGRLNFIASATAGSVRNEGLIAVGSGGQIALIAPNVENSGVLIAPSGEILLAAGRSVQIASMDFDGVSFAVQAPTDSVLNLGRLIAQNGAVQLFASKLTQNGVITAAGIADDGAGHVSLIAGNSLTLGANSVITANGRSGGSIVIESRSGTSEVSGTLEATGSGGSGGTIELLGQRVALNAGSSVDASGATAGGQILVGGDYQGKNSAIENAQQVYVDPAATLAANATVSGNGGRVIVWSDQNTAYFGSLSAHGAGTGSGGSAEVSGHENLDFAGAADLTAPAGAAGTLLLDPLDIIISSSGGILPSVVSQFSTFPNNVVTISPAGLNRVGGNVVLQAGRNIEVDSATTFTGSSLTLDAGMASATPTGQIFLNQGLSTTGGALALSGYSVSGAGALTTAGGSVSIHVSGGTSYGAAINSGGGAVSVIASNGSISGMHIAAGGGSVTLSAAAGGLSGNTLSGGTIALTSSGAQSDTVTASSEVIASSSSSYVSLSGVGGVPLRLGSISSPSGIYLYSGDGIAQASGSITAPYVYIDAESATGTVGSGAAPLSIATSELELHQLGGAADVALKGAPTLNDLYLEGTVAALGATRITGAANVSTLSLSQGSGVVNLNAVATSGFTDGLTVHVTDGGLNAPTINIPGEVSLSVTGAASLGSANSTGLVVNAGSAINITTATATNGNITLQSGNCSGGDTGCTNQSPITAGVLSAPGAAISISSTDNGTVAVTTMTAGSNVSIYAGDYNYYASNPRTSAISLGSVTSGGSLSIDNFGTGNVTASGALSAYYILNGDAVHGAMSLTTATSGGSGITLAANGSIGFATLTATGSTSSGINLTSDTGNISSSVDSNSGVITAAGAVSLTAGGFIGNPAFAHPLSIEAGPTTAVSLDAGGSIGAAGRPVTVNTNDAITVESDAGSFYVAAENAAGTAQVVSTISLSASAAGLGAGGTSTFSSKDLSIAATSNGATISIGNVVQSADSLNQFAFSASGTSGLSFGNVALTTSGNNQLLLSAGGALSETTPGTNNIVAGNTALSATGLMTLGNVTSAVGDGNALTINSGTLNAGNMSAESMTITSGDISAGALSTSGTLRGYYTGYVFDPLLGYSTYVTDEMHITSTGALSTSGAITSATSAYLTAASGISVVGGTGNISGGNSNPPYYTDTVSVAAGTGILSANTISAFTVSVSGTTLDTGNITALSSNLSVSGTTLNTGNLTAPTGDVTVSGSNFATGNIVAGGSLNITATGNFLPGGITISGSGNATITAGGAIDLSSGGAALNSPSVILNAGGNVAATLLGTSQLGVTAAGTLDVSSNTALSSLELTARGDLFGGASSITAPGQSFTFASSGTTANLSLTSPTSIAIDYSEQATGAQLTAIGLSSNLSANSTLELDAGSAAINANSIATHGGGASFSSASSINLVSVNSGGGAVSADSSGGNIGIGTVVTGGGAFSAQSDAGNITRVGAAPIQIDTNSGGAPSGSVTLSAPGGGVGATATPIVISNTVSLSVDAPNTIALDMNGTTLSNLAINTSATGSGTLSIANNPNFVGFTLTRSGGDLELGPVAPTVAGNFALTASAGNIVVNGNINVSNLTLDARDDGANSSGTLSLVAGGSARSVVAGTAMTLAAGGNILIASGSTAAATMTVNGGNSLSINSGGNVSMDAAGGATAVSAVDTQLTSSGNFQLLGGSSGIAGAAASFTSTSNQSITAHGTVTIEGGSASGASATLAGGSDQSIYTGSDMTVQGGSGPNAFASINAGYQNLSAIQGALLVKGGGGAGAYASIAATSSYQYVGNQDTYYYSPTSSIAVEGGSANGAYATITGASYQSLGTDGNISVIGGSATSTNASIVSSGSSQSIGSTYGYYTPATKNITVEGGSVGNAIISAVGSQVIEGGGAISVLGGTGTSATASISNTGGSQTIGDAQNTSYYSPTQSVAVRGGGGTGASASITTNGSQVVDAGVSIVVAGGAAGAFALVSTASQAQTLGNDGGASQATQTISVIGGNASGGSAKVLSGTSQVLFASQSISVTNVGSDAAAIDAQAAQVLYTSGVTIDQASALPMALAEIKTAGTQSFVLSGASGTASMTIDNTGSGAGSLAQAYATGNQTLTMPYSSAAGLLSIGSTNALGASLLYAGGTQSLLTGAITIQGGASAAASATITAVGDSTMSGITGTVSVLGGSAGAAAIDPPNLDLITNGSVIVTAGAAASATATITAGNINIGASNGNVIVTGGSVTGAAASIAANGTPGTLNMYSSGNLEFVPNAGGATVSAVAPSGNNIFLLGDCIGCAAGLVGVFNISAAAELAAVTSQSTSDNDTALSDLTALLDYLSELYSANALGADGEITFDGSESLPQCN